jgi:ABC-type uncharacterized transport system permease subunit
VAGNIAKGVHANVVTLTLVGAGLLGAILWDLLTWWLSLPTSSSHALLGGMAGATDLLGATHSMTTTYGTTVGFDAIAVALLGRTSPIGIVLAALLFGAMRTGASAMQIQAGVPADLVGVLQATILFFLVIGPVIKRIFRVRGAKTGLEDETQTFTATYGGEATIR